MKKASAQESIDRYKVLEKVGSYRPRVLNISGGEPTLVKELPLLLKKAKEQWNPFIRVVHNGTGLSKLKPCFPYLDRIVVSIDGPGAVNASTRGLSGDSVLERIREIVPDLIQNKPELIINTVVTEMNLETLPGFASQIRDISPDIVLALLPVMPPDSDISILRNSDGYDRFLKVFSQMLQNHSKVIHNFDCLVRHENLSCIQCYNQYFMLRFSPAGDLFTCGMNFSAQLARSPGSITRIFRKGGLKKAFTMLKRQISSSKGTVDFSCRNMCNCDSWLDMLLLGKSTGYAPFALKGFKGRLSEKDFGELDLYVKKHINPTFDVMEFRCQIEEA